ncbi:MAG TPA: hypothetical protein VF334_09495 [Polyangia bacterium]
MVRALLLCGCVATVGCSAGGVPIDAPPPPFVATAGELDVQDTFIELVFGIGGALRKAVQTDAHAPDGAIAPIQSFPGGVPMSGSLTVTGAATNLGSDESFTLTGRFDRFQQPGRPMLSTAPDAPLSLTLELVAIPDGEHDLHGELHGEVHGTVHDDSGPLGDFGVALTLHGLLYVHADGTHDGEMCQVSGTLQSPAYGKPYTSSYAPF